MTDATLHPSAAEAARSLLVTGSTLRLAPDDGRPGVIAIGGYLSDARGRVLLPVPIDHPMAGLPETPALVEVTDLAPVAVRDRNRGRLQLGGWLSAIGPEQAPALWQAAGPDGDPLDDRACLLRFEPIEITLTLGEARPVQVDPDAYAAASPDPLAAHEAEVLQHLAAGHAGQLAALRVLLPRRLRGADRVVPLRLHRRALVLRVEFGRDAAAATSGTGATDVALALPTRGLTTASQVMAALQELLTDCCGGRTAS